MFLGILTAGQSGRLNRLGERQIALQESNQFACPDGPSGRQGRIPVRQFGPYLVQRAGFYHCTESLIDSGVQPFDLRPQHDRFGLVQRQQRRACVGLPVGQPPSGRVQNFPRPLNPRRVGRVNARAAVNLARGFVTLGAERSCSSGTQPGGAVLPDNAPTPQAFIWNAGSCPLEVVESVTLRLLSDHPYSGDLRVLLRSPTGRVSELSVPHSCARSACTALVASSRQRADISRFMIGYLVRTGTAGS